jgi:putative hydrolase of the HAD superfamily
MAAPNWWPDIELVVWDLDGTLYPSDNRIQTIIDENVFRTVAKHLQVNETEAESRYQKLRRELKSSTKSLFALGLDGRKVHTDIWDLVDLQKYLRPNPALVALFRKSKLRHRLLTNSNRLDQAELKLRLIGFEPADFEAIHTSVTIEIEKPDPRAFHAVQFAAEVEPGSILMVGDRIDVDVLPAQAIGWHGCLVRSENPRAELSLTKPEELFFF